jgi:hypothetical protein
MTYFGPHYCLPWFVSNSEEDTVLAGDPEQTLAVFIEPATSLHEMLRSLFHTQALNLVMSLIRSEHSEVSAKAFDSRFCAV